MDKKFYRKFMKTKDICVFPHSEETKRLIKSFGERHPQDVKHVDDFIKIVNESEFSYRESSRSFVKYFLSKSGQKESYFAFFQVPTHCVLIHYNEKTKSYYHLAKEYSSKEDFQNLIKNYVLTGINLLIGVGDIKQEIPEIKDVKFAEDEKLIKTQDGSLITYYDIYGNIKSEIKCEHKGILKKNPQRIYDSILDFSKKLKLSLNKYRKCIEDEKDRHVFKMIRGLCDYRKEKMAEIKLELLKYVSKIRELPIDFLFFVSLPFSETDKYAHSENLKWFTAVIFYDSETETFYTLFTGKINIAKFKEFKFFKSNILCGTESKGVIIDNPVKLPRFFKLGKDKEQVYYTLDGESFNQEEYLLLSLVD